MVFFFIIFGLPQIDFVIGFFPGAVLSVGLYTAAFVCEAMRSGINAVSPGQAEASRAIGPDLRPVAARGRAPAGVPHRRPPAGQRLIAMVKNTSIAAGFSVSELSSTLPRLVNANAGDLLLVLLGVVIGYMLITLPDGLRRAPARATGGDPAMSTPVLFDVPGPKARARQRIGTVIGAVLVSASSPSCWSVSAATASWTRSAGRCCSTRTAASRRRWARPSFEHAAGRGRRHGARDAVGLLLAVGRLSDHRWVRAPVGTYIEFFRAIPLLVVIFALYFVLPTFGVA